jgi:hypothetical protein
MAMSIRSIIYTQIERMNPKYTEHDIVYLTDSELDRFTSMEKEVDDMKRRVKKLEQELDS